jgi:KaiC/GvpD/RAD55 family RecA-like ATPase
MSKLNVALAFHRLGFNVIPTGADKRFTGEGWKRWHTLRLSDGDLAALEWERSIVVGLAAISGAVSGHLVALDLDGAPSQHAVDALLARLGLPRDYAWTVHTPGKGGGWHVWIRSSDLADALTQADLKHIAKHQGTWPGADHIELRWQKCYTLLPPSRHPDGRYAWAWGQSMPTEPPTEVPGRKLVNLTDWAKAARKAEAKAEATGGDYGAYIAKALAEEACLLGHTAEPGRNDQLNASVFAMATMAHAGAERALVESVLVPVARSIGLTDSEIRSTFASAWEAGCASPRKMPEPRKPAEHEEGDPPLAQAPEQSKEAETPPAPRTRNLLGIIKHTARYKSEPMPAGIDYPWSKVNKLTRGLRPGWLCYLAGYPGSGKTAAALEIIFGTAKRGKRVLLNTLEMSDEEIALRLIQRWGLDTERLFANKLSADDLMAFDNAANFPFYGNVELVTEHSLKKLNALVEETRPDLLVIDYLGLMDIGRDSLYEGTTKLSMGLKNLARTHGLPTLCLSQLTRPQDKTRPSAPSMHDLRSSGQLEGDADQIIFVYREQESDSKTVKSDGRFIVAKARFGRPGAAKFTFDGDRQLFVSPAEDRAEEQGWSVHEGGRQ